MAETNNTPVEPQKIYRKLSELTVPSIYAELFQDNYRYFILPSGRVSGKTSILVMLWWLYFNKYPNKDIVICQSTSTEIKESIINEIFKFLQASGLDVSQTDQNAEFYIPKTNDLIRRRKQVGETRIFPITDSQGGQRARGVNTKNAISLVLFEEAQRNKDRNVLEQAVVTFIRQLDKDAKLVVVGNNETRGHWFVDYAEEQKRKSGWCCIYSTYKDIWKLLNKQTQEYIEECKRTNYLEYRRVFLGDIDASTSDVVFPMYDRDKHYLTADKMPRHYIQTIIIGCDHATANDTFTLVPVAIWENGACQTLEVAYDDPQESNRSITNPEQADILDEFLVFLDNKYGLVYNGVNVVVSIDGAASSFIQQVKALKHTSPNKVLWKDVKVCAFTKKRKKYEVNLNVIRSAFIYNTLTILNEGKYNWLGKENKHRLDREIVALRFKNGKLDPSIPNDFCDALEYALVPYYSNCYKLSFPVRKENYDKIRKMANLEKIA